jgi:DNA-binding response OmpR family regulator
MFSRQKLFVAPTLDEVRKRAQILIIDDQEWPHQNQLEIDHFHVTRWSDVEDTDSLTNGSYALVLLDINGVGMRHSPERQGIGILDHIKKTNPAQVVIVYSAKPQAVNDAVTLAKADAVMDKSSVYFEFREKIDNLLVRRASPDHFIASMNLTLGADAAKAPKAVPLALKALRTGNVAPLESYLSKTLGNEQVRDVASFVIGVGIKVLTGAA